MMHSVSAVWKCWVLQACMFHGVVLSLCIPTEHVPGTLKQVAHANKQQNKQHKTSHDMLCEN